MLGTDLDSQHGRLIVLFSFSVKAGAMLAERASASSLLQVIRFDVVPLCAEGIVVMNGFPLATRVPRRLSRHTDSFRFMQLV